jgi:biopolymer transport protein ExbB
MLREIAGLKTPAQMDKAFDALSFEQRKEFEKGLPVLGTLGSTTPFVGLLGTILGIIVSFGELSQGTGSTNSVMFSLAEALILTAVGLVVAIPAVVAYNYFGRVVKLTLQESEALKDLFLAYRE